MITQKEDWDYAMTPADREVYDQLLLYMDIEFLLHQYWKETSIFETALIALKMQKTDMVRMATDLTIVESKVQGLESRLTEKGWTKIIDQNEKIKYLESRIKELETNLNWHQGQARNSRREIQELEDKLKTSIGGSAWFETIREEIRERDVVPLQATIDRQRQEYQRLKKENDRLQIELREYEDKKSFIDKYWDIVNKKDKENDWLLWSIKKPL